MQRLNCNVVCNTFVLLIECQNLTPSQLKTIITRCMRDRLSFRNWPRLIPPPPNFTCKNHDSGTLQELHRKKGLPQWRSPQSTGPFAEKSQLTEYIRPGSDPLVFFVIELADIPDKLDSPVENGHPI